MRTSALVLALALAPAVAAGAARTDVKAPSRIDAVTVYQSSARVTRTARVELPAGDARLLLEGLTDQLVDDSLRVQGAGSARAAVFGVSVERVPHAEEAAVEVRAAREKVEKLERQDRALEDQGRSAAARKEFLDSLRSTYAKAQSDNLAVKPIDVKEWGARLEFLAKAYEGVLAELRKVDEERKTLARELQAARQELAQLQAKGSTFTRTVAVELKAERGGTFELEVSYLVPSASWSPVLDARLDPDKQTIELTLQGSVQQTSGEDWTDVKLSTSTAQPSRGIYVPELFPLYLEKYFPVTTSTSMPSGAPAAPMAMPADEAFAEIEEKSKDEDDAGDLRYRTIQVTRPEAQVTQGLLAVTYTAPRRESVDGAGQARRAFLATYALKAEVSRTTAPKVEPQAFLTTRSVNETGVPLLAGPVNIFLADEFVGRTSVPLVPSGDELKLAFGPDDRVKVERKVVERKRETEGVFSKSEVYRYRIRTTVKNLYDRPVSVVVLDQVPVSRDEDIEVKVLEGASKPTEPEDPMKPGVRVHRRELKGKAEEVLELRYEVRYPRGQPIRGLE